MPWAFFCGWSGLYDALPQSSAHETAKGMATPSRRPAQKPRRVMDDYLQKILTAKVYDVAVETGLEAAPALSARLGNEVLFKRDLFHGGGSSVGCVGRFGLLS